MSFFSSTLAEALARFDGWLVALICGSVEQRISFSASMDASDTNRQRLSLCSTVIGRGHDILGACVALRSLGAVVLHRIHVLQHRTVDGKTVLLIRTLLQNCPPDKDIAAASALCHMRKVAAQRQWYKVTFSYSLNEFEIDLITIEINISADGKRTA